MNTRYGICVFVVGFLATAVQAQIVVDGTLDPSYGPPIVVQTVQTQFGDATPPGSVGGSELDAGYALIEGGRLYIMLTGNLEPNFNKLEIFIDSKVGGENVLSSTPDYDFFNGANWNSTNLGGMTFDAGFVADYHLFARWGGGGTGPFEVDYIDRQGGGNSQVPGSTGAGSPGVGLISTGLIAAGNVGPNASGSSLSENLLFAINDNNALGVAGGAAAADQTAAAAVTTGMEFSIALADLDSPAAGEEIRIAAMIGNGDHNFLSNQILGGLPAPQGNLGGDGSGNFTGTLSGIDFNNFGGPQYFTIVTPRLPVELTSFDALANGSDVFLAWSTASELNNAGFEVEGQKAKLKGQSSQTRRSVGEDGWEELGFVDGYGTTSEAQSYTFQIRNLEPGTWNFRLKQIDFDGAFEYSPVVEAAVTVPDRFLVLPAYPNPFNPTTTLRFAVGAEQLVDVTLVNAAGQSVRTLYSGTVAANEMQQLTVDADGLPSGTYLVHFEGNGLSATERIVLMK